MGEVPASRNAFMEMVTDKCTRMTFLLMEMHTWNLRHNKHCAFTTLETLAKTVACMLVRG